MHAMVLVKMQFYLEQAWSTLRLTCNTVTWMTFSCKPECGEGGNKGKKELQKHIFH